MNKVVINSKEFNKSLELVEKTLATQNVIFVKDRDCTKFVVISEDMYDANYNQNRSLAELLSYKPAADIDFDPPKMSGISPKPADFS